MPTSFAFRPFPLAILLLAVVAGAFAQDPTNADGVQPLEAQYSEVVLNDLNLHLDIPIVNKAGVGLPFAFGLHFNNNFYDPISGKWAQNWNFMGGVSAFGWVSGDTQVFGTLVGYSTFCPSNPWYQHMITLWGYMDTSGTLHSFPGIPPLNPIDGDWGCGFGFSSLTGLLSYNYNLSFNLYFDQNFNLTATLTAPNGSVLHPAIVIWDTNTNAISHSPGMSLSDVNSNSITKSSTVNPGYQTFTDTLAVQELKYAGQGYCQTPGGSGDTSTTYLYPTSTGASSVLVSCKRYSIQTNFGCAGVSEYPATYAYLVDSVTLADNSQYKFTYESQVTNTVTGRLASVTFPKGALYKYTYVGSNAGTVCGDGSVYGLTRTTPDGTWTFSRPDSTNSAFTTTVTGPSPSYNTTKYTFSSGELLQKQVFQGSSALLKTDVSIPR